MEIPLNNIQHTKMSKAIEQQINASLTAHLTI